MSHRTNTDPTTDELMVLAYERLRTIAERLFRTLPPGHTLQPTAVVHEAYVRVSASHPEAFADFAHFVNATSRAMRHVLVDHYRRSAALRRGGDRVQVTLTGLASDGGVELVDVVALNTALEALGAASPRRAQVVELRFFGGFTMPEVAAALEISLATAEREWRGARAWLRIQLALRDP